jgi:hypothetical protein
MKRKAVIAALLVCCFCVCMAVVLADLSGKWTGLVKTPDGNDLTLIYVFKVDGEKLTGTVRQQNEAIETKLDSGKVIGNDITFSVTNTDGVLIRHNGKYYGDSISMNFDFNGTKFHTTLKRADN